MPLVLVVSFVALIVPSKAMDSAVKTPYDKNGEIAYMNIQESSLGFELIFDKIDYLISNSSVESNWDCELKCLYEPNCLSGISVKLNASFRCLLFNWSSTDFGKRLSRKVDTASFQLTTSCQLNNPCQNGGECIANTGPFNYVCNCTNGYAGRNCSQKCVLFDFESGRLDEWVLTGTVFNNQPTYGDNPTARGAVTPSKHKGRWWIGGVENRPSPSHPAGQLQGDALVGTMTSPPFIIKGSTLKFLIGGGTDINKLRVELLIGGVVVDKMGSASYSETMQEKSFNVAIYREKVAQLRVVDNASGSWGHINVDHFEDMICTE